MYFLRENVSWQATCNSVGFVAGGFIGNAVFILLESAEFCNQNIRPLLNLAKQPHGFIDMKSKPRFSIKDLRIYVIIFLKIL